MHGMHAAHPCAGVGVTETGAARRVAVPGAVKEAPLNGATPMRAIVFWIGLGLVGGVAGCGDEADSSTCSSVTAASTGAGGAGGAASTANGGGGGTATETGAGGS